MPMNFSLSDAEELAPDNIQSRIVRQIENTQQNGQYIATDVFPLYEMAAPREVYHRLGGLRAPAEASSLVAESNVAGLEGLEADEMNVTTIKEKISPEKGIETTLNSQQDVLNIMNYVASSLRVDLARARSFMAWRQYAEVPGVIGANGLEAHPKIPTSHIIAGGDYSTDSSNPHDQFMQAAEGVSSDGDASGQSAEITAYVPTSVLWDLKRHPDLEGRFTGVQVQNISTSDLSTVLPIDGEIREIRTKVPRTNANGEPIDDAGNVVSVDNAVADNILEPWDPATSTQHRNIVLGMFGEMTAVMPWFPARLAEHLGQAPSGRWTVDRGNGFLIQQWTTHDPAVSWQKIATEQGFEVLRGDNLAIIQDV